MTLKLPVRVLPAFDFLNLIMKTDRLGLWYYLDQNTRLGIATSHARKYTRRPLAATHSTNPPTIAVVILNYLRTSAMS